MDFFERQWSSYRAIVDHDLMEHRSVADCTAEALKRWLSQRPASASAPSMVDLGCGDLALLAPMLRCLQLGEYTGLDLAAVVLPLAQQALGPVPYTTHWQEGDLLRWALDTAEAEDAKTPPASQSQASSSPDILHSAFAIHHLDNDQKFRFLEGARRRIKPGGIFIWADVFCEPGESRADYADRYAERIKRSWSMLDLEQRKHVETHLREFDIPADRELIENAARSAGWHWKWAWQGQHQAEAVAILKPT